MGRYRDDVQETIYAEDTLWTRTRHIIDEFLRATIVLGATIAPAPMVEALVVSDNFEERISLTMHERLQIEDSFTGVKSSQSVISEALNVNDHISGSKRVLEQVFENLTLVDDLNGRMRVSFSDHLIVSDTTSGVLKARQDVRDNLKIAEKFSDRLRAYYHFSDNLAISEDVGGKTHIPIVENLIVTNQFVGKLYAKNNVSEKLKVVDNFDGQTFRKTNIAENLTAFDSFRDKVRIHTTESILSQDAYLGTLKARQDVIETLRAVDIISQRVVETLFENLESVDTFEGKLRAKQSLVEVLFATDAIVDRTVLRDNIIEKLQSEDRFEGKLSAIQRLVEELFVDDHFDENFVGGAAWTGNTENWATSRYSDFTYHDIAVIGGQLVALSDGIHILDANRQIDANILTGKIDLGNGSLIHPSAAYLEYELGGDEKELSIDVITTQSGATNTYNYVLPKETADQLTNGRVIFGRGLRGRHFSFNLKISAARAHINDIGIEVVKTSRRI